jgi:mono/diheme cytochrome c family protein
MRTIFAKLLVAVTGLLIVVLAILFAAIRNPPGTKPAAGVESAPTAPAASVTAPAADGTKRETAESAAVARGRTVYVEQRCRMCHAIDGQGNARSPLDGVGGRLTDDEIRRWIVAPQEMQPGVAKRGYQLSPEDLEALVAYLKGPRRR